MCSPWIDYILQTATFLVQWTSATVRISLKVGGRPFGNVGEEKWGFFWIWKHCKTDGPTCMQIPMEKWAATWGRRRYKGGLPVVLYLPEAQMNELQPKNANIHRFRTTKMAMPQESSGEPHFYNYYVEHISSCCCCRWDLAWDLVSNVGKPGKRPGN